MSVTQPWIDFCKRGKYKPSHQRASVTRSLAPDGSVRGFYSDLPLDPTLPNTHSLYPSHDHTSHPKRDQEMVVDARIVNDMKSHLNAEEFWRMVEHLYAVGVAKGTIPAGEARRLDNGWCPLRHFGETAAK